MSMFNVECEVDSLRENRAEYNAKNGLYFRSSLTWICTDAPNCVFFHIKIPEVKGSIQNIEVEIGYTAYSGGTIQWALRPFKNSFFNPTGQVGTGYYSSLGDVDMYVTHSTSVSDNLQVANGTIHFPSYIMEYPGLYGFVKQVIPGDVVNQGQWYTFILWGKPTSDYISIETTEITATANYASGLVRIDTGSGFDEYLCYVDNGTSWDMVMPYIDNGSGWDLYT